MRPTYRPPSSGPEGLEPSCAEARCRPLSLKEGKIVCVVNRLEDALLRTMRWQQWDLQPTIVAKHVKSVQCRSVSCAHTEKES